MNEGATIYVATPVHDSRVHLQWVVGVVSALHDFRGRIIVETYQGSWLPRNRDALTAMFLASGASHMLCVDSDIAWDAGDLSVLLATGADVVSGCYARKQEDCSVPVKALDGGEAFGPMLECEWLPAGFLLLARAAVLKATEGAPRYTTAPQPPGEVAALWTPMFGEGEDVAFCRRLRASGARLWCHTGVTLGHVGERVYRPPMAPAPQAPDGG